MAIRIRVNPGGTAGMPNIGDPYGGLGNPAWAQQYYGQQERHHKQKGRMAVQYQRALGQELVETAKLQTALQFGSMQTQQPFGGFGMSPHQAMLMPMLMGGNPMFGAPGMSSMLGGMGGMLGSMFGGLGFL